MKKDHDKKKDGKKDRGQGWGQLVDLCAVFDRRAPRRPEEPDRTDPADPEFHSLMFAFLVREKARQIVAAYEQATEVRSSSVLRAIQEETVMEDLLEDRYDGLDADEFDDITQVNLTPKAMIDLTRDTPEERRQGIQLVPPPKGRGGRGPK